VSSRKFFARLVENWPAKILSLGLAIILFVFHRMNSLEARYLSVPLNIEGLNSLTPSNVYPRMIRVSLKGEANSLFLVMEDDIEVYVDMEKFVASGTYLVPVQWRKKGNALRASPLQINVEPMEISFSLDQKISKFVPLTASFRGYVENGYTLASYFFEPNQLIIDGPAGLMGGISELYTEPIDLNGRSGDFSVTINVLNRDPLIIIRGSGTSEFHGIVSQIIPVRNILNVPIAITGIRGDFSGELEIKTGNIHIEGENQDEVEEFDPHPDFLRVDCSGISEPGIYVLRVLTDAAENIRLRVDPPEVKIQISVGKNP
jgi:hypothetical protein